MMRRWGLRDTSRFLCKVVFEWYPTRIPHIWLPFRILKHLVIHPVSLLLGLWERVHSLVPGVRKPLRLFLFLPLAKVQCGHRNEGSVLPCPALSSNFIS